MKFYSFHCDEKLAIIALIETADKDFFAMIDEETQQRLKELEEGERLKELAIKAQLESAEVTAQQQSDSENEGSVHNNGVNEEFTNGLHENGHAEMEDKNRQVGEEQ